MTFISGISVPLHSVERENVIFKSASESSSFKFTQATLPESDPTKSFWLNYPSPSVNELAKEGSEGDLTNDADICIIGSGITGVSAAYHLSRLIEKEPASSGAQKLKIVIIEARDFCKYSKSDKIQLLTGLFIRFWSNGFVYFACQLEGNQTLLIH